MDAPADKEQMIAQVQAGHLRVHLPALVLAERERQLVRQEREHGRPYSNQVRSFRQMLNQLVFDAKGSIVLQFDRTQAEQVGLMWAAWLNQQPADYLTRRVEPMHLKDTVPELDWIMHKFDWFIAAVARQTGWILVTNDADPPFHQAGVNRMAWADFVARYLPEPAV